MGCLAGRSDTREMVVSRLDEQPDSLGLSIGGARDGNASIAVTAEHDLLQILVLENTEQVGDVRFHTDPRTTEVRPLAHTRERRCPGVMALCAEFPRNRLPLPATTPPAVNEYERCDRRNVPRERVGEGGQEIWFSPCCFRCVTARQATAA